MTDLRRELRVSDDEHREILTRVNADETIRRIRFVIMKIPVVGKYCYGILYTVMFYTVLYVIREWRESGGHQTALLSTSQPIHDLLPSPTVSGSRKKQKTSQLVCVVDL